MPNRFIRNICYFTLGTILILIGTPPAIAREGVPSRTPQAVWQAQARWRRGLLRSTSGTLALTATGVEFRPIKGPPLKWQFEEIQTCHIAPHRLTLTGYQNRRWHLHGERSFRFDLKTLLPPSVAAELAVRIGKPLENGVPSPTARAFASLGARHRTRGGGTNGMLRFRESGVDYITQSGRGARSWRWADIETIARPDPYHFRVGGYREIFDFELKDPMSRALFERLWNKVYALDLRGLNLKGESQP